MSAARRGRVPFPADPHPSRRYLRLPRPRRLYWNPCLYRWRRRQGLPAGACPAAAAPAWYPVPARSGFPFRPGLAAPARRSARCRCCHPNRLRRCYRLRRFRRGQGACPACRTVISCGAACRMGLSGSADRMPMSGRQILSSSAQINTPQPACCTHGYLSRNFFMCVRPPGKGLPPSKSLHFVQLIRTFKKFP